MSFGWDSWEHGITTYIHMLADKAEPKGGAAIVPRGQQAQGEGQGDAVEHDHVHAAVALVGREGVLDGGKQVDSQTQEPQLARCSQARAAGQVDTDRDTAAAAHAAGRHGQTQQQQHTWQQWGKK